MPTIATEVTFGPRPSPHTMEFFRWVENVWSTRRRSCQVKRTNIYYIDPAGSDSNDGSRPTQAWATLTPVRTRLAANTAGGDAFLFKRNSIIRDATGIDLIRPNCYFGAYGAISTNVLDDAPQISHFVVRWASGGTRWTLASGNRYTSAVAVGSSGSSENPTSSTTVGFVRVASDPFLPLTAVASTAECESTPWSFFVPSTAPFNVSINLSGVNPNDVTVEAVPVTSAPPDGIRISDGSSGVWIDGLRFDGWGCGNKGTGATAGLYYRTQNNESGIRNLATGDHVALITRCQTYYDGAHSMSQEPGGVGGTHILEGCVSGLAWNGAQGQSTFNCYAGLGGNEFLMRGCVQRFGPLPQTVSASYAVTAGSITNKGKMFYGHTGGGGSATATWLYVNWDCRQADERALYSTATTTYEDWAFSESTDSIFKDTDNTNPASIRAFVIGWKSPRLRPEGSPTTNPNTFGISRMIFINCHLYIRHTWGLNISAVWSSITTNFNALQINPIFEIENENGLHGTLFWMTGLPTAGPRILNGLFVLRGHTANGANDRWTIGHQQTADRLRLGNCIIIADRWRDNANIVAGSGKQCFLSVNTSNGALNGSDSLANVAIAGCSAAGVPTTWQGFNAAPGFLNLETSNTIYPEIQTLAAIGQGPLVVEPGISLDPLSVLAGVGAATPFPSKSDTLPAPQYDFFGRRRPSTPSIGPFDVLNTSTGSGGGLASGASGSSGLLG